MSDAFDCDCRRRNDTLSVVERIHKAMHTGRSWGFEQSLLCDLLRDLRELQSRRAQDKGGEAVAWMPIETAPKMRKVIVHYMNALGKHRVVMACYYLANSLEMHDDYASVETYEGDGFAPKGWYEEHDQESPLMPLVEEPTHWMPLPAPPASEAGAKVEE